ncbi:gliding motility-associated ABC transporter ATP-binding subunit GldA, partial [Flavihumibacter sediminis]|nr:gliding motility-associated ABC transporter ATP-binding subunit GldA [Flavihumibacter sediminis]
DPNQIIEIREVIRSLGAQKTILFSTHILQEVEAVCSRVIIINKGNLIADNNLKDLQSSHSKPVIRVQFKEALEAQWLERAVTSLKELQKINAFE